MFTKTSFSLFKLLRRFVYFLLFLLVAWVIAVQVGCMTMRTPDRDWQGKLQKAGQHLPLQFFDIPDPNNRRIHTVSINTTDSLPLVVLGTRRQRERRL